MEHLIGDLIGEAVAYETSIPELKTEFGKYTLLDSPETMMIPDSFKAMIAEIGDTKPMFVTVAVPIGLSRSLGPDPNVDTPHRRWPEHVMDTLAESIRQSPLPGHRGHQQDLNVVADPAVLWVAAGKGETLTGEKAILARGYVYDANNNRHFIKTGSFNSVSPLAMSRVKPEMEDDKPVMLVEQANWLSLDFVRKNTEGIRGAAIVTMEGADMKLTPEQVKLISELSKTDLEQYNPVLVAELGKSSTSNTRDDTALKGMTDRVQELTRENATLMVENATLTGIAQILGCESKDLPGKIAELQALKASATQIAMAGEIAKIGSTALRNVVEKRLKDVKFSSTEEAVAAVVSEVAAANEYIASMSGGFGAVNATGNTGGSGGSGVLNAAGQAFVGGNS
jgi:hypothetical protein